MTLPDFFQSLQLNTLREQMGNAPLGVLPMVDFNHVRLTVDEIDRLSSHTGIAVDNDEIKVLDDGTLAYKDSRVLVYIRDVQYGPPRFHISHCSTLQEMREKNRWGRYVVATREDGKFEIRMITGSATDYRSQIEALAVCKNCLTKIKYKEYSTRRPWEQKHIVEQFTLADFFSCYPKMLHDFVPKHNSDSAPTNTYTKNFDEISIDIKHRAGWKCSGCPRNLSNPSHRKYLQTHHRDGQKSNNREENLAPLCLECHAEEPNHGHMKALPLYKEFIRVMEEEGYDPRSTS